MRVNKYSTELDSKGVAVLVKESKNYPNLDRMDNPDSIYRFCIDFLRLDKKMDKYVYVLCFDSKARMIGYYELSHRINDGRDGSHDININPTHSLTNFLIAWLLNAASVVIVHNHLGDPTPSMHDKQIFEDLKIAGRVDNIKVIDSIIIGRGGYCSTQEN